MALLRIPLAIRGAVGTPLRGDTLWGEVCWALRESEGEGALVALLVEARRSGDPPFLLSDAFPHGWLPRPLLPSLNRAMKKTMDERRGAKGTPASVADLKRLKRSTLLPESWLREHAGGVDAVTITEELLALRQRGASPGSLQEAPRDHVSLSRLTSHALRGALFVDNAAFPSSAGPAWEAIAEPRALDASRLVAALVIVGLSGHGADASIGLGAFDVRAPEPFDWPGLPGANALLALGPFCPSRLDSTQGFWKTETKFGRVGNVYSSRPVEGTRLTPFKKPLVMLTTGSVLGVSNGRRHLGRLVENIHALPQVVHGACCPALPLRITDPRWAEAQP
jgi:CRISPR-associated protein Csm4